MQTEGRRRVETGRSDKRDGRLPWRSDYERRPVGFPTHLQRRFRRRDRPPLAVRLRRGRTLTAAEIAAAAAAAAAVVAAVAEVATGAAAAVAAAEVMEAPARTLRGGGVPPMGTAWGGMRRKRRR